MSEYTYISFEEIASTIKSWYQEVIIAQKIKCARLAV